MASRNRINNHLVNVRRDRLNAAPAGFVIAGAKDGRAVLMPINPQGTLGEVASGVGGAVFGPLTPYIFLEGKPTASEFLWIMMDDAGTFPINFAGSFGIAIAAATASTVVNVRKLSAGVTTTIGTATWGIAGTAPSLATTGGLAQSFLAGDAVGLLFPASPDATLGNIALSLRAQRN